MPTRFMSQWAIPGCPHHKRMQLSYMAWTAWADEQENAGHKQTMCAACKLWLYPCEIGAVTAKAPNNG